VNGVQGGARFTLWREWGSVSYADFIDALRTDTNFRDWFNALLADNAITPFRWETPPVTEEKLGRPFEFVLLDAPGLARRPDPEAFQQHFANSETAAVAFSNLGGDAILVVPRPIAEPSAYGHLGAFVCQAPTTQCNELWQLVGETVSQRIGTKPVWLSTAGAGVSWLHVRFDDRPKYYRFEPYRTAP
jgi:hypothetical protein